MFYNYCKNQIDDDDDVKSIKSIDSRFSEYFKYYSNKGVFQYLNNKIAKKSKNLK